MEVSLRAIKLLLSKGFLPCDIDGCQFWFCAGYNFRHLFWLVWIRKFIKKILYALRRIRGGGENQGTEKNSREKRQLTD